MAKKSSKSSKTTEMPSHLLDPAEDLKQAKQWLDGVLAGGITDEIDTGAYRLPYHDVPWHGNDGQWHGPITGRISSKNKWPARCADTHPPLKIPTKNGEVTVYGGACGYPVHDDLDIYVALDDHTGHDKLAYPWHGARQFILFPITDMSVPKDPEEFKLMIEWLAEQIMVHKKKVHIGCLGGHGRTGMVLAALVKNLSGEEDAISYVRKHYCQKAVETHKQAEWLHQHFGIKVVDGYKEAKYATKYTGGDGWGNLLPAPVTTGIREQRVIDLHHEFGSTAEEVPPMKVAGNVWGMA